MTTDYRQGLNHEHYNSHFVYLTIGIEFAHYNYKFGCNVVPYLYYKYISIMALCPFSTLDI